MNELLSKSKPPFEDEDLNGAYRVTAQFVNQKLESKA
jgi:hypothetical protein